MRVDVRQAAQEFDALHLILHFDAAHARYSAVSNGTPRNAAAAIVEREHDVAVLHEVLMEQAAPGVGDPLHAGAAVDIDEHRVTFPGLERARLEQLVLQRLAVGGRDRAELRSHVLIEIRRVRMRCVERVGEHRGQRARRRQRAA